MIVRVQAKFRTGYLPNNGQKRLLLEPTLRDEGGGHGIENENDVWAP
jgi:hypothetical protein